MTFMFVIVKKTVFLKLSHPACHRRLLQAHIWLQQNISHDNMPEINMCIEVSQSNTVQHLDAQDRPIVQDVLPWENNQEWFK